MNDVEAVEACSALAQGTRLAAMRLLLEAGPGGMASGDAARHLGVPHNTLSTHLAILARAGLVSAHRTGRTVTYVASPTGFRTLLAFLLSASGAQPEAAAALLDEALPTDGVAER